MQNKITEQLPPIIADTAFNKPHIEEVMYQIDTELSKLSNKIQTTADAKEEKFIIDLKQKLEETKDEYAVIKEERNEKKLLNELQNEKTELLKNRSILLEETIQKSFKVQKSKNSLKNYNNLNEDLESELDFLVNQLSKSTIKTPELQRYLYKLDKIEEDVIKQSQDNIENNSKEANLDINAIKNKQLKKHTSKAEQNIKMLTKLKQKKEMSTENKNNVYILDNIFNDVLERYTRIRHKGKNELKNNEKMEVFETFLNNEETKKYIFEIVKGKYTNNFN